MNGAMMLESETATIDEAAAMEMALGVFDVLEVPGSVRAAILDDGTLVRVSPVDPMAVWPVQQVTMLVIEHYAVAPSAMRLRVHTSCGQALRLSGEVSGDTLLALLRLESSLTLG